MSDAKTDELSEAQTEKLRTYLRLRFQKIEDFHTVFAVAIYLRPEPGPDDIVNAKKALQRILANRHASIRRMNALATALRMSLEQFDREVFETPNFCKSTYALTQADYAKVTKVKSPHFGTANASTTKRQLAVAASEAKISKAKRRFLQFFGEGLGSGGKHIQLAFPKRVLKAAASPFKETEEDKLCPLVSEEGKPCHDARPEGVSGYLAFEDIKAATHISALVTKMTESDVLVRQDSSHAFRRASDSCIISFGLGFAAGTRKTQRHFHPELFWVYCVNEPDDSGKTNWRVNIKLRYQKPDRDPSAASLRRIDARPGKDIALIARIVPKSGSNKRPMPWLICGGRTAIGTAVAGYFLANSWEEMYRLYGRHRKLLHRDSLAIVIEHDIPEEDAADSVESPFAIEKDAKIRLWDSVKKEQCVAWGQWGGG